jgi:hypothetical protein
MGAGAAFKYNTISGCSASWLSGSGGRTTTVLLGTGGCATTVFPGGSGWVTIELFLREKSALFTADSSGAVPWLGCPDEGEPQSVLLEEK